MRNKLHLSSNRNAVKVAESEPVIEKTASAASAGLPGAEPASLRIRRLRDAVRDLLLDDDLEHENGLLLSGVAAELNELLDTFDRLASMQKFFECLMV